MAVPITHLSYGTIIRAWVSDESGRNWKNRCLVIITPTRDLKRDEPFICVCITSAFPAPVSPPFVEVPSRDVKGGHPATKLQNRSAAACQWLRQLEEHDVDEVVGSMPPSSMENIEKQVRLLNHESLSIGTAIKAGTVKLKGQVLKPPPGDELD